MKPQLNVRVAVEVRDTVARQHETRGVNPGFIVEEALREYFERRKIPVVPAPPSRR